MQVVRNVVPRMPIATVSEQQWQQAFCELRRTDWPANLADLRRQSLEFRLVRLRATLIARGILGNASTPASITTQRRGDSTSERGGADSSQSGAAARYRGPDRKCLAAGDRDDD